MEPKYTEGSNGGRYADRHSNAQIPRLWREFGPIWIKDNRTIKDTYRPHNPRPWMV